MVMKKKKSPKHKKVVIDYPEVPTRTWIPPDSRAKVIVKPPQINYKKPAGMDQKLPISSLKKMWHFFEVLGDRAVISGTISQNSKRFSHKTRGFQAPANVIAAITFSQLYEMPRWKSHYIDKILIIGDQHYIDSRRHLRDPRQQIISLSDIYKTFYIGNEKITIDIKKEGIVKGSASLRSILVFQQAVRSFFDKEYSCVLTYLGKYYALWRQSGGYYVFDPYECDKEGVPWTGLPNNGVACLIKFLSLGVIINHIIECSMSTNVEKGEYSMTPVYIQRVVHVNTKYPDCMKDANLEVKPPANKDILQEDGKQRGKPEKTHDLNANIEDEESEEEPGPKIVISAPPDTETIYTEYNESRYDAASKGGFKEKEKKVPLIQKPEAEEISYYVSVIPDRMSILRAPGHQCNPNFSKYLGQQSFANAYSAIAMLHMYKPNVWTTRTVEDILKGAEQIHHNSLKTMTGDQKMKVTDISQKITCSGVDYSPKVDEYTAMGRLYSDKEDISDLTQALREVLSDNDAVIITGPLIVAFWNQEGFYYMWDPNERSEKGAVVIKQARVGSFTKTFDYVPGYGCVTRFTYLKDMVSLYMLNVPRANRRDPFILSKVEMEDFSDEPLAWFNFKALRPDKWILCGSFNQSDVKFAANLRNTQCTSMAAMFLAYAHLSNIQEWTTEKIDEILVSGNDYYGLCVNALKESGKFSNRLLMAAELLPQFVIDNKKLILNLEELVVYGTLTKFTHGDGFGHTFRVGLKVFFEEHDYGILTCSGLSVAIFKYEEGYFVADSHSRNEKGHVTHFGTAVVIRHLTTDDLANSLETNYAGSGDPTYNIHRVTYEMWNASDEGALKPPLNEYTAITDYTAILRGPTSQDCPTRFPLTFGKQQVPMGLAAIGMIKLTAPGLWTLNVMDLVLKIGNEYYRSCIEQYYKEHEKPKEDDEEVKNEIYVDYEDKNMPIEEQGEDDELKDDEIPIEDAVEVEEESDAITAENVLPDFMIGINKFTLDYGQSKTGIIVDLPGAIQSFYQAPVTEETDQRELLIESNPLTIALWRDNGLYYYFDPKPRDEKGHVYGKDEWTLIPPEELALLSEKNRPSEVLFDENEEEGAEGGVKEIIKPPEDTYDQTDYEDDEERNDEFVKAAESVPENLVTEVEEVGLEEADEGEGIIDKNPMEDEIQLPPKQSASYWKRQEIDGTACVMWFTELDSLINHVIENIPPRQQVQRFRLTHVKMQNIVSTKNVYDPESGPKETKFDGDWHNFKEVTHGHWLLRGTSNLREMMFPISNRGRQYVAISFAAAAFVRLFALSKFENKTVDSIIKYGDKLHTSTRRVHKTALEGKDDQEEKRVCAMTQEELDTILKLEQMDVNCVIKKFCIGEHCVTITVQESLLYGELFQNNPEVLTLENALGGFFGSAGVYAVLQAKGVHLFITKYHGAYFMFDPDCRGPSAHKSTIGDACFSRHLNLQVMCGVIVSNLTVEGSNTFYIHSLDLKVEPCERVVQVEDIPPTTPLKISGYNAVIPGKHIVSGTTSLDTEKYIKFEKQQAAPVNMVALAMTLIHRSENWTKVIIDEIVRIGSEVYQDVMDASNFNPWEQKMSVFLAPTDFKIGSIQVNCEIRNNDQRGIVDMKSSRVQNLRRGLELFFVENTHGIISTYDLMVAVWKPEGQNRIYMFDGGSRGSGGMPAQGGGACVLAFDTPKLMAEHFTALTPVFGRRGAYVVVPIEIVAAKAGKKRQTKRAIASKEQKELLAKRRRHEEAKLSHKGRKEFHVIADKVAILHADRSQNSKHYSKNSRGNQDLTNCVMAYVMDKLIPVLKWNFVILQTVMDIGDQLYKDSVVKYNPTNPKLGVEALQRSVVVNECTVKIAVGKPIVANNFNVENLTKSLEIFYGSRSCCMLNVADTWLTIFKKNAQFYLFDPQDVDITGNRVNEFGSGFAAVLRFDELDLLVEHIVRNIFSDYSVFCLIVIAIKDIIKPKK